MKLENMDSLGQLKFLRLDDNLITTIENLDNLINLEKL